MEAQIKKNDIEELLLLVQEAATIYQKMAEDHLNNSVVDFIGELAGNYGEFMNKINDKPAVLKALSGKNQMSDYSTYSENSALDILLMCIEIERRILEQTRNAVHNCDNKTKELLCKQLVFSEKALFKADQLLEQYE